MQAEAKKAGALLKLPGELPDRLTIATRGSPLALWQASFLAGRIRAACPQLSSSLLVVKTRGDRFLDTPLAKIGGKGLFVKEIEECLLNGQADLAIHSMKDVPMHLPEGLEIGAVLERGAVEEMFLSVHYPDFSTLPAGAKLGTSSLRRRAQALSVRPDLEIVPLRGNIATRISKLEAGQMDAIILAAAGVARLELSLPYAVALDSGIFVPAAGQGALGVEYLACRQELKALLQQLDHAPSRICVEAERAFVRELGAGCHAPAGAIARLENNALHLHGFVASENGLPQLRRSKTGLAAEALALGSSLAREIREEALALGLNC